MIEFVPPEPVDAASPCTGVCTIDDATDWCIGCGRTIDEIVGWGAADVATRRAIRARLPARMAVVARPAPASRD